MRSVTSPLGGQNLDMQTPDITSMNIENIAKLFPNVITEKEDNGKITKAIDFDLLKQQLSKELVEDNEERYTLNWPGKKASLLKANTPINKTLRPCREDSVNFDTTENLYIEGDNFEVLKILQESYLGKVKMIYIDPPYNTGKDFVYKDNFKVSKSEYEDDLGVEDEEGGKLFKNTDTNGRFHSDWLSMMYERLTVARDLLKDDGVIFMSIDDNEVHNLKKISDEIFGEENFVANLIWQSKSGGSHDEKNIVRETEYILIYTKNVSLSVFGREKIDNSSKYKLQDEYHLERGNYLLKKLDFRMTSSHFTESLNYSIEDPDGNELFPGGLDKKSDGGWNWRWSKDKVKWGFENNFLEFRNNKGIWVLNSKQYEFVDNNNNKINRDYPFRNIIKSSDFNTTQGSIEIVSEFGSKIFEYAKSSKLLKHFIQIGNLQDNDIILDFFSGSATTAHAVMKLNAEDGGDRKFICVQLKEETDEKSEAYKDGYKNICEIGKERIRRAGKKIIEENKEELEKRQGELSGKDKREHPGVETPLDTGFRVYKTDSSNMKDVFYHPSELKQGNLLDVISNIKEDRSSEDLLTQVILDLGLTLDMPIEKKTILGNTVYFVAGNSLVACFDENIDFGIVDEIAKDEPLRVVFRDSCFKTDSDRINFENRFKKISGESDIRVI